MDRCDALQQPAGLVEVGQGSGVVGACVVRDDRGLAGAGFLLEQVRCEGRLLGVLVLLGRVRRDCSAGRGRAPGKDWDVFFRSTDRSGALSFRGLHAAGPGLVLGAGLVCRVDLPAGVQQGLDSGRRPGHAFGGGRLVAVLVERVRAVRGSARTGAGAAGGRGPTGVRRRTGSSRRHVSPGRPRTRRGHPPGRAAGPGRSRVLPSVRGRVPPRPGSPHARPGPGASWWPATRPAIPALSSRPARPSSR